jgi:hypothetical protein
VIAYFDANPIDHCLRHEAGVTRAMVERLQHAVADGRLTIPASVVTTEELLSATVRDEAYGFEAGRFYLSLASLRRALKQPRDIVFEAVQAYARRTAEPTPYAALGRRMREAWERLAAGQGAAEDVQDIVQDVQGQVDEFHAFMLEDWEDRQQAVRQARAEARRRREGPPALANVFHRHAPAYAESFARRAGVLRACRTRGITGLLARRRVLAAAGGGVVLVYRQVSEGLRPDRGDSRDLQHLVMAAATRGVLVTHDRRLRLLAERIPGLDLRVVGVPELLESLDQE